MIFPEKDNRKKAHSIGASLFWSLQIFVLNYLPEKMDEYGITQREAEVLTKTISERKTLKQAGIEIGVTPERIRQIEAKAIEKIISSGF